MPNIKIDLSKIILFTIALLGIIYFINNINKEPISVIEIIEKENTIAIEASKKKVAELTEQLILSQKRELKLLKEFKLIQENNEKANNKFDSTIFSNIELQQLFSNWRPEN